MVAYHICVEATGKTVNRGVRSGLEIYVNYSFMEMQELWYGWQIAWKN